MPDSAAFRDAWGSLFARRVQMLEIQLTSPSSLTLRLATSELWLPDRSFWQECIRSVGTIHESGDYLECGPNLSGFTAVLENKEVAESAGQPFASLLGTYSFQGATVYLYEWERSLTQLTDRPQRFKGVINRCRIFADSQAIEINVLQSRRFNKKIPRTRVSKIAYPDAPEVSFGSYLGIALGDWRTLPLRDPPFSNPYTHKPQHEGIGGNVPKLPCIVTDRGTGTNPLIALAVEHAVDAINTNAGLRGGIDGGDFKGTIAHTTVSGVNGASGSGLSIPDETMRAFYPVVPIDVRVTGSFKNTADNPKNALDYRDETTFATVDTDAGKGRLQLMLPNLADLGAIDVVSSVIQVSGAILYYTQNGSGDCTLQPVNPADDSRGTAINLPASTTPTSLSGAWAPASFFSGWSFGRLPSGAETDLLVTAPAGQKIFVLAVGLYVQYKPSLTLLQQSQVIVRPHPRSRVPAFVQSVEKVSELRAPISTNLLGPKDDGSGTWTGTASAYIERHTDAIRYLLSQYGSLDKNTDFEMGAGSFGSFLDARDKLKTMELSDYVSAFFTNRRKRLIEDVKTLAEESLCQVELDPQAGKWMAMPWVRQPSVDYGTLYRDDLESLEVEEMSDTEIFQEFEVRYALDPSTGERLLAANVGPESSEQGFMPSAFGDQKLQVTASNKVLKFSPDNGSTIRTATLDELTYSAAIDLADNLQSKMRTADSSSNWFVGYGCAIKTSFNDQIKVDIASTIYTATLRPFLYTWEALAREVEFQLNSVQTARAFVVTFSRTTGKFQISTGSGAFTLKAGETSRNGLAVLGFAVGADIAVTSGFTVVAGFAVHMEHFWIAYTAGTGKLYMSPLVQTGTTCATLLGWLTNSDPTVTRSQANRRRGTRQTLAAASVTSYGEREPFEKELDTIRLWNVAGDFRDRSFDFRAQPKVRIIGVSRRCRDLRRGNTIALDPTTIDRWAPYPRPGASGSHSGKVYRVLDVAKHNGPDDFSAHFIACEVGDTPVQSVVQATTGFAFIVFVDATSPNNVFVHKISKITGAKQWGSAAIQVGTNGSTLTANSCDVVPDGIGGCVVAFIERTASAAGRIKAQRIDANGNKAWGSTGIDVTSSTQDSKVKREVRVVADSSGNYIIAWLEERVDTSEKAFVQKLDSAGSAQWTADGVELSTASTSKSSLNILADGAGGAFFSWRDAGSAKLQRVNSSGAVQWGATGVTDRAIDGESTGTPAYAYMCSDAADGILLAMSNADDAWGQRYDGSGTRQWAVGGVRLNGTSASDDVLSTGILGIVPDGVGGAITAWCRATSGVRVQRFDSSGALQFGTTGTELDTTDLTNGNRMTPYGVVSDLEGGAIVTWEKGNATTQRNLFCRRIKVDGTLPWAANVTLCNLAADQGIPSAAGADGFGGIYVIWNDLRSGSRDIYGQRVDKDGVAFWTAQGLPIDTSSLGVRDAAFHFFVKAGA